MPKDSNACLETPLRRDIRVDRLGLVDELVSQFRKPLADKVKADMAKDERVTGDSFTGLLVTGTSTEIDAEKFVGLWEAGKMTRAEFISAIKVGTARAKELLAARDLARISTTSPTSPALRVARIKGVEIELVTAVAEIAAAVAAK